MDNYSLDFGKDMNDFGSFGNGFAQDAPADGCTLCGMCLSYCPTYKATSDIRQSPMARIQVMREVVTSADDKYQYSIDDSIALDSCLVCRACENMCPSKVPYADMLVTAKQTLTNYSQQSMTIKVLMALVERPALLRLLVLIAKPLQPIAELVKKRLNSSLKEKINEKLISDADSHTEYKYKYLYKYKLSETLRNLNNLLQGFEYLKYVKAKSANFPVDFSTKHVSRPAGLKKVELFTGCMSSIFDRPVLDATRRLLVKSGVEVLVPENQTCCGAIHTHNGEKHKAAELALHNINAFSVNSHDTSQSPDAIISVASGCGQELHHYDALLGDDVYCVASNAKRFTDKVRDISTYLIENNIMADATFSAIDKVVLLHTPCSMKCNPEEKSAMVSLLQKIPGITLLELPVSIGCCGSGGSHMMTHPAAAKTIRNETIDKITELNPDIVLTANVACGLHLKEGLLEVSPYKNAVAGTGALNSQMNIEVLHPVQLIERQIYTKETV